MGGVEGSAIPDSVAIQYSADSYTNGDSTWSDDATGDGSQDMSITGDPQETTLANGDPGVIGDATDDVGFTTLPSSLEGSSLTDFAIEMKFDYLTTGNYPIAINDNSTTGQAVQLIGERNENINDEVGNMTFSLTDQSGNRLDAAPTNNPSFDDGSTHTYSISVDDATTNSVSMWVDGSSVSVSTGTSEGPNDFTTWNNDIGFFARSLDGSGNGYSDTAFGIIRIHDQSISSPTL